LPRITPAAKVFTAIAALPFRQLEFTRISLVKRRGGLGFDGFEAGTDVFLERAEPVTGALFAGVEVRCGHGLCLVA
jgi:hypothetical protein